MRYEKPINTVTTSDEDQSALSLQNVAMHIEGVDCGINDEAS